MDEVTAYLAETKRASVKLFRSVRPMQLTNASVEARLPPKPKRRRSPSVTDAAPQIAHKQLTEVPQAAKENMMRRLMKLVTPSIHRSHPPLETFVKATIERYNDVRERILTMRMSLKDRHGDRSLLLKDQGSHIKALLASQYGLRKVEPASHHYFSFPLSKPLVAWYRFLQAHGPLEPVLAARSASFTPLGFDGQPAMTMLSLASDGDLNNLFGAVLTKVVRGAKEGCYEIKNTAQVVEEPDSDDEPNGIVNNRTVEIENIAWLYHTQPTDVRPARTSVFKDLDIDVMVFTQSLVPTEVSVGTKTVVCKGYGPWVYTVLAAIELPLDPVSERLLQQLYQLVCKAITAIRSAGNDAFDKARAHEVEEALCSLDTILVILCRQFHLNNSDLVPL